MLSEFGMAMLCILLYGVAGATAAGLSLVVEAMLLDRRVTDDETMFYFIIFWVFETPYVALLILAELVRERRGGGVS